MSKMKPPMLYILIAAGVVLVIGAGLYFFTDLVNSAVANEVPPRTLELKNVGHFEVVPHTGTPKITIRGLVMESALSVGKLYTSREGNTLVLRISLVPANGKNSGSFEYVIDSPSDNERIVFGNDRVQIWP